MKNKKTIKNILVILGLAGVFIPHIGFLANLVPNLNLISHAWLEIVSGLLIAVGYFWK